MGKKVLLYHVVSGEIPSSAAKNNIKLDSVQGAPILVNLYLKSNYYDGFITINGQKVKTADLKADNGVIHIVSSVLYPIPDKEALTAVLLRHALPGTLFSRGITWQEHKTAGGGMVATQVFKMGVVKVVSYQDNKRQGARVEEADIIASNGVIHAIDTVI